MAERSLAGAGYWRADGAAGVTGLERITTFTTWSGCNTLVHWAMLTGRFRPEADLACLLV